MGGIATSDGPDWTTADRSADFGRLTDADEYLHGTGPAGDSLSETWYWGFGVPEASVNCFVYCWVHPNLGVATSGLTVYRGLNDHHLTADVFDVHAFLDAERVVGDGSRIEVPNGLTVTVVEPMRHVRIDVVEPERDLEIHVDLRAVAEPVVRPNGLHFEQVMHATGSLRSRGDDFTVDSHSVRDRSWGELRPEAHNPHGPYSWITGVTDGGAGAFNLGVLDLASLSPDQRLRDGWLWRDGRVTRITSASVDVTRDPATGRPAGYRVDATDAEGRTLGATGHVTAGLPWSGWPNMVVHLGLVQWRLDDGTTAWGESQECQWNDHVRALRGGR